jgi:hypothetical protein
MAVHDLKLIKEQTCVGTHRTLRSSTGRAFSSRSNPSPSSASNPFFIPPPKPEDLPPISERLKPLIPFILYWTALTSLAYHLMQVRTVTKEDLARKDAQLSVLESLVGKYRMAHEQGTRMDETEVERELQMVGLRERTSLTEGEEEFMENRKITWKEIFFGGSSRAKLTEDEQEDVARKEWQQSKYTSAFLQLFFPFVLA